MAYVLLLATKPGKVSFSCVETSQNPPPFCQWLRLLKDVSYLRQFVYSMPSFLFVSTATLHVYSYKVYLSREAYLIDEPFICYWSSSSLQIWFVTFISLSIDRLTWFEDRNTTVSISTQRNVRPLDHICLTGNVFSIYLQLYFICFYSD